MIQSNDHFATQQKKKASHFEWKNRECRTRISVFWTLILQTGKAIRKKKCKKEMGKKRKYWLTEKWKRWVWFGLMKFIIRSVEKRMKLLVWLVKTPHQVVCKLKTEKCPATPATNLGSNRCHSQVKVRASFPLSSRSAAFPPTIFAQQSRGCPFTSAQAQQSIKRPPINSPSTASSPKSPIPHNGAHACGCRRRRCRYLCQIVLMLLVSETISYPEAFN